MYRPGVAEAEVGGDFYDVFLVDGGLMVLMGDVTGKGVKAAALTSLVRYTARTAARYNHEPAAVLAVVDQASARSSRALAGDDGLRGPA